MNGPSKIMIIRHAEKPGIYGNANSKAVDDVKASYSGINAQGESDPASLVTMGWERAGGIANLFYPSDYHFLPGLAQPTAIYASNPTLPGKYKQQPNGNYFFENTSQRPAQTISALYGKMAKKEKVELDLSFAAKDFKEMIKNVLTKQGVVLISWQHEYILPKEAGDNSLVHELFTQTNTPRKTCPTTAWPGDRYDMILVLDRDPETGQIVKGEVQQVPQLLLYGDKKKPIF